MCYKVRQENIAKLDFIKSTLPTAAIVVVPHFLKGHSFIKLRYKLRINWGRERILLAGISEESCSKIHEKLVCATVRGNEIA